MPAQLTCLIPILYVSDFEASLHFYTEKLGFVKEWDWGDPPGFGAVSRDGLEIFLCHQGQGHPGTWMSIFVRDVDALAEELRSRGVTIACGPVDEEWGVREMMVKDPDDHVIRFGQAIEEGSE